MFFSISNMGGKVLLFVKNEIMFKDVINVDELKKCDVIIMC